MNEKDSIKLLRKTEKIEEDKCDTIDRLIYDIPNIKFLQIDDIRRKQTGIEIGLDQIKKKKAKI